MAAVCEVCALNTARMHATAEMVVVAGGISLNMSVSYKSWMAGLGDTGAHLQIESWLKCKL